MSDAAAKAERDLRMTAAEYLAWEPTQEERYEYHDGRAVLMTGGSLRHTDIGDNVFRTLDRVLPPTCRAYGAQLKVSVRNYGRFLYPDAAAISGPREVDPNDAQRSAVTNPTLAVEVLSPSTEAYDRGRKFEMYRSLASFTTYVLVAQDRPGVEVFSRVGETWRIENANDAAGSIALPAVGEGVSLPLGPVYESITFDEEDDEDVTRR